PGTSTGAAAKLLDGLPGSESPAAKGTLPGLWQLALSARVRHAGSRAVDTVALRRLKDTPATAAGSGAAHRPAAAGARAALRAELAWCPGDAGKTHAAVLAAETVASPGIAELLGLPGEPACQA